jgi:RecJ-like exonuclease
MSNFGMKVVTLLGDDGEEGHELPAKFEVCPCCQGHGTHLAASLGGYAYTQEEFYESFSDEVDRAEYFKRGGIYDVLCEECRGRNVVLVVDEEACLCDPRLKPIFEAWREQEEERALFERECRAERAMEARMLGEC